MRDLLQKVRSIYVPFNGALSVSVPSMNQVTTRYSSVFVLLGSKGIVSSVTGNKRRQIDLRYGYR